MSQVNNIDCGVITCLLRWAHCHYYYYTLLQNAACSVGLPNHIHALVNDDLIIVTLLYTTDTTTMQSSSQAIRQWLLNEVAKSIK